MTEAELIEATFDATDAVLGVVSIYFSIISAYVTAVYFFLSRSPFLMKLTAFAILSGAMAFLGLTIIGLERTTSGVIEALAAMPDRDAAPAPAQIYFGLDKLIFNLYDYALYAGWLLAAILYISLFYLTFLHPWKQRN